MTLISGSHSNELNGNRAFAPSLPYEIIQEILSYFPQDHSSQPILRTCTLISRAWYSATIARLYQHPHIPGPNYESFVNAVCPSINAHIRRNGLAELVKTLDLGSLVHHGRKSLTARLLGRVKGHLEVFVAPQTSFAINALTPLSKCTQLRHLDLSLVSEALTPPVHLIHTLQNLKNLETLHFPRAGKERYEVLISCWPERLQKCVVTGGLTSENRNLYSFPQRRPHNLTHLTIGNCGMLSASDVEAIVSKAYLPKLEYLWINQNIDMGPQGIKLLSTTTIRHLRIPASFTWAILQDSSDRSTARPHNLDTLELDMGYFHSWHRPYVKTSINTDTVWDAVAEGSLGNLRRMLVHVHSLDALSTERDREEFDEYLKALAREDGNQARFTEDQAGLRTFG